MPRARLLMDALLERSATDMAFRRLLLTDPRAALREFTGQDVPDTLDIRFVEREGHATIVLPEPRPAG